MSNRNSRSWALSTALLSAALLAGCSANSGVQSSAPAPGISTAAAPVVSVALSPANVDAGQTATLTWDSVGATSCNASGAWNGLIALANPKGQSIGPFTVAGTYTYGLTCSSAAGKTAASQTLTVGAVPPPNIQFNLLPSAVTPSSSALLVWSTTNASSCTASAGTGTDGWHGSQPTQQLAGFDTGPIATSGQYEFDLSCLGPGGTTQVTRILTVASTAAPAAPTLSFAAQPALIQPNQSSSLTWTSANATACTASGGSGSDSWSGSQPATSTGVAIGPIAAAGTYSYTLTCRGLGGSVAKSVAVVVSASNTPPTVSLNISASPTQILAGGSSNLSWSSTNADSCIASGSWSGAEPLLGSNISTGTLTTPAAYSFTLTCSGIGGSATSTASLTVNPAPPAITSLAATPAAIQTGQSTSLSWGSTGAVSCVASGGSNGDGWSGPQSTASSGIQLSSVNVAGTYIYTLICNGIGGASAPRSVAVTVSSPSSVPSITNFSATPASLQVGQGSTLTWNTNAATSCVASGGTGSDGWHGAVGTSSSGTGTGVITTAGSYTYTLSCTGPGGAGTPSSVVVNVNPAPTGAPSITGFTATPANLQVGQAASLAWSSIGANFCTATGGTGSDGWGGAVGVSSLGISTGSLTIANDYTYTLTCTGAGGTSPPSSVIVNVNNAPPPAASITSFNATPGSLQTGQSTSLAWSTTSATACAASGGAGSDGWSGVQSTTSTGTNVGPLTTSGDFVYTLTCSGPGGTGVPASVTVDVNSAPPAASILSFTVVPQVVQTGQTATAAWSSSHASACTATGGTGSDGWGGTVGAANSGMPVGPLNATGPVTYTLTCTGSGGASAPSSATIELQPAAPPASIITFSALSPAVQTGQSSQFAWTTGNATACTASGGSGADAWSGTMPIASLGTSSGPLNTAGTYTYTLTCSGPGGSSAPSSAMVTVTNAPPPATVIAFSANPSTLQVGQSTELAWSSNGASACTAGGGDGTDGWNGEVAILNSGMSVGPINTAGTYVYTLTCTGAGGSSAPTSVSVTVNNAPTAAVIVSFSASPTTLSAGQSTHLAWNSTNATSCTATGGSGSDGWSGPMAISSSGTSAGPLSAGTITYTLTCVGPGGTSIPSSINVIVNPATPTPPTVALEANGSSTAQITLGNSLSLSWTTSGATSCIAGGGTGADGWSGSQPISSAGIAIGPISTPGIYSYTLTCTGPGGTASSTVQITAVASTSFDCGLPGIATAAWVAPAASVITSSGGLCVLECSVTHPGNVIDSSPNNYATLSLPLAVLGYVSLEVSDNATFPAGRQVGFVIANGNTLLNLALLGGIEIETLRNGVVQETAAAGDLLSLQAAGLLAVDQYAGFAGFTTHKSFDSVRLTAGSLASLSSNLRVYGACVSQQ